MKREEVIKDIACAILSNNEMCRAINSTDDLDNLYEACEYLADKILKDETHDNSNRV